MKNIIILGATGSIGRQTLDVLSHHKDEFQLVSLAFGKNIELGIEIIKKYRPEFVSVTEKEDAMKLQQLFNIEVGYGRDGLVKAATYNPGNNNKTIVVTAVVGSVGLVPTIEAIKCGYDIALANKETLVSAGHIVLDAVKQYGVSLLPVDSEHSALFQILNGEQEKTIKELIITASGGSFRNRSREELKSVTLKEALNHPNWKMGGKITIDSATMMNKGFEVIEAHYLFGIPYEKITTLLHKESVIHSMIEFQDTSIIAQLGNPDMRIPIQYALTYPERKKADYSKRLKLSEISSLHFQAMDFSRFPCLKYAYDSGIEGGSLPTVLNAANEAAVHLFLKERISFLSIEKIIYEALNHHKVIQNPDLDTILSVDKMVKDHILTTYSKGE